VMYWDSDDAASAKMLNEEYTTVSLDEKEYFGTAQVTRRQYDLSVGDILKGVLLVFCIVIGSFTLGFGVGQNWKGGSRWKRNEDGLLPPQAFVPDSMLFCLISKRDGRLMKIVPVKEVVFEFPTQYQDTGPEGDKLWNDLMPRESKMILNSVRKFGVNYVTVGSGFVRVPWPRRFDMPQSKAIPEDPEEGEVYSLSITHQLHCLGVLRDVIRKYEVKDKSRFAGDGHEYHCLDYSRSFLDSLFPSRLNTDMRC